MARYNRIRGPFNDLELTSAFVTIPGFTLARSFDDGILLCLFQGRVNNLSAGNCRLTFQLLLDDEFAWANPPGQDIPTLAQGHLSGHRMFDVSEGLHTLYLQAKGAAAAGDVLLAGSVEFVLIQLPLWDSPDTMITL